MSPPTVAWIVWLFPSVVGRIFNFKARFDFVDDRVAMGFGFRLGTDPCPSFGLPPRLLRFGYDLGVGCGLGWIIFRALMTSRLYVAKPTGMIFVFSMLNFTPDTVRHIPVSDHTQPGLALTSTAASTLPVFTSTIRSHSSIGLRGLSSTRPRNRDLRHPHGFTDVSLDHNTCPDSVLVNASVTCSTSTTALSASPHKDDTSQNAGSFRRWC